MESTAAGEPVGNPNTWHSNQNQ